MKNLILSFLVMTLAACSRQSVENAAVLNVITDGQWKVVQYNDGTTDLSSSFTGYLFQFKMTLSVDAILNNAVVATGQWSTNLTAKTITSQFNNANNTVMLLNGTWQITDSGASYVVANQVVNGTTRTLRLEKN